MVDNIPKNCHKNKPLVRRSWLELSNGRYLQRLRDRRLNNDNLDRRIKFRIGPSFLTYPGWGEHYYWLNWSEKKTLSGVDMILVDPDKKPTVSVRDWESLGTRDLVHWSGPSRRWNRWDFVPGDSRVPFGCPVRPGKSASHVLLGEGNPSLITGRNEKLIEWHPAKERPIFMTF